MNFFRRILLMTVVPLIVGALAYFCIFAAVAMTGKEAIWLVLFYLPVFLLFFIRYGFNTPKLASA